MSFSSSKTTLLAAMAGAAAVVWGATAAGRPLEAIPLIPGGAVVGIAGSIARVTRIRFGNDHLEILFAVRRSFIASWSDIRSLRPPGTPLGGWRLTMACGAQTTLMPSDLFGHEELLGLIVRGAGLRFDGRAWISDPGDGEVLSKMTTRVSRRVGHRRR
jgi:hypothetical protein